MIETPEPLTPKEDAFCLRIVAGDNGTRAAIAAGYSAGRAAATASELIRKRKIITRITALKSAARAVAVASSGQVGGPPVTPDVSAIVLDRAYLIRRLLEIQHGQRDATALAAIRLLGQEEFKMFGDLVVMTDPSKQSTDDLTKMRDKIRKKHGLTG